MKQPFTFLHLITSLTALLLPDLAAFAVTFTNDTLIRSYDTNYDGAEVVVTNCTLTVDGPHAFAGLQVLDGGNVTHTFTGSSVVSNWFSVTNEPQVLSVTNVVTLSNASVSASTIVVQDAAGLVTYSNSVDYTVGADPDGLTTLQLTTNSTIAEGSTNLVSYEFSTTVAAGLSLTVTGDVTVAQGGRINVDGKGYSGGVGPGSGRPGGNPISGSGAGHGGFGGQGNGGLVSGPLGGVTYDSIQQPTLLGSGGGSGRTYAGGGAGGGAVRLAAGGTMRVDGVISANGASAFDDNAGGGSGGSIWLSAQSFTGSGQIFANGGSGEPSDGGGGAGGRISLGYDTGSFIGTISARGGSGYERGGAGTIYTRVNGQTTGQVLVDNGGRNGARTSFFPGEAFDLTAQGGALIVVEGSRSFGNLVLKSNAWLSLVNQAVTVTGNAIIDAGGGISADGAGYAASSGPGRGTGVSTPIGFVGGGGAYGGYGAAGGTPANQYPTAYGGTAYGSATTPVDGGSGGGSYSSYMFGGPGGGSVRVTVTGMLLLNGRISADGIAGVTAGGGGGAGGSIWLTVGTLAGGGVVSANGGMGNGLGLGGGGGGGGGRIAVSYTANLFFGTMSARGAGGAATGGAGTIYTKVNSQTYGLLLADNGGQSGTNTTWAQVGALDLTVKGGAVVAPPASPTFGTLLVASNGWMVIANNTISVIGNATVQFGGGILADGTGNPAGSGPGAGRYTSGSYGYVGGGGGYGGYGGSGSPPPDYYGGSGGTVYGSVISPTDLGSGGGAYYGSTPGAGGAGGGAVRLTVPGVLQVDGIISAAGQAAPSASGGGGSGGSIALTVGTLEGTGVIAANGGAGNYKGGGGGGGRIAINYVVNGFSGVVSAYGGSGIIPGGAGTVFTKANNQQFGQVIADNAGQTGTNTSWAPTSAFDLVVRGGAVVSPPSSQAFGTLVIASNGWMSLNSQMLTANNATVQAGGGIIADGTGYAGGAGTGAGRSYSYGASGYIGGGGGYGGYGASGFATSGYSAGGGTTYGYVNSPSDLGSGGGGYNYSAPGGAGGGAVRLTVTYLLQVDGRISARGLPGAAPSSGGGSGGSIALNVGSMAGSGVISANGGAGNGLGGGGGGGRIGITYSSAYNFSGLISAYGGAGYGTGGAGSIYLYGPGRNSPTVVLDNGGQAGTNSGWPGGSSFDVTIKNGASLGMWSSTQTAGNLLIGSNGWIYVGGTAGLNGYTLSVSGNATIQAGGGIIGDGGGFSYYNGGQGQGGGAFYNGYSGGGGFGGAGGSSGGTIPAAGGRSYGLVSAGGAGSAGGSSGSSFIGGAGGAAISLNVTGTLQVDGRISSAGGTGTGYNAGGGSGGGVTLAVGTLIGSGVIAANGGAGNGLGGGGGGGRIVVNYSANSFVGTMSAYGGAGYTWGGAGTIFTKPKTSSLARVLVDNGGRSGTNTSWTSSAPLDLVVVGGAVLSPQGPATLSSLFVGSNAWVNVTSQVLTVTSNVTVQAGGGIVADGTGYGSNAGPGAGRGVSYSSSNVGGGGGYGGYGAAGAGGPSAYGGGTYGSATAPVDLGSGGGSYNTGNQPAGAGGGAIRMNVIGALLVNGRISANGGVAVGQGSGGGSGGSVYLTAGTLSGAGTISANGGSGNGVGGGGGGGRVSVQYGLNAYGGLLSACGGSGSTWGGAGTIYTKANSLAMGQMVVDNGGHSGTNTPIAFLAPFDLTVRGGAVAYPSSSYLLLSNLFVNDGGVFTCLTTQTNLDVEVLRNATIDAGGLLIVDGRGFAMGAGPGAGVTVNYTGSGAGYGGNGGASSAYRGGVSYGSTQQPVDRGSGGGQGWGVPPPAGGEAGGAIRLTVGGALTVNGRLSANGSPGMQDDAGGGSGGSIWLTTAVLAGAGTIAAEGGAGELYDGGGGGGGRIAIYTPLNVFGGLVSAAGGAGFSPGEAGSIYYGALPATPAAVSIAPTGIYSAAVSTAEVVFSMPVNPSTVGFPGIVLMAPGGITVSNFTSTALTPYRFHLSFPAQTDQGEYALTVGPQVLDLYGQPLSQSYTGTFAIAWTFVQGFITNTSGEPVPDVVVQSDRGGAAAITDTNGNYVLGVPPGGLVTITASKSVLMFVPASYTFAEVTIPVTNQNFLAVSTTVPTLATEIQSNSMALSWYGIPGITYQPLYSTDLVEWLPYDGVLAGTNGPLQLLVPMDADPIKYFRVRATY